MYFFFLYTHQLKSDLPTVTLSNVIWKWKTVLNLLLQSVFGSTSSQNLHNKTVVQCVFLQAFTHNQGWCTRDSVTSQRADMDFQMYRRFCTNSFTFDKFSISWSRPQCSDPGLPCVCGSSGSSQYSAGPLNYHQAGSVLHKLRGLLHSVTVSWSQ